MAGAIIIIVVCAVAIPVGVLISGGVGAAILGSVLKVDADKSAEGSELLDSNY